MGKATLLNALAVALAFISIPVSVPPLVCTDANCKILRVLGLICPRPY